MAGRSQPTLRQRVTGGLLGLIVGDALGVPYEFKSRHTMRATPASDMVGFGTHNQPPGTWSDDSSMALATAESLLGGYRPEDMMSRFHAWLSEARWTPHGTVFDIGGTTRAAIERYAAGRPSREWGGSSEGSNGNGGLMRMLPLSLYVCGETHETVVARSSEVCALTHAHRRSTLCCAYYSLVVGDIVSGLSLEDATRSAAAVLDGRVPDEERAVLSSILSNTVFEQPEEAISSGGYVVHSLEASLWCCHHFGDYPSAVLAAVNLGGDTDTTAAIAGGLAGVIHGRDAIPDEWVTAFARREDVLELVERFAVMVHERIGGR